MNLTPTIQSRHGNDVW